jgi:hypothetical protein
MSTKPCPCPKCGREPKLECCIAWSVGCENCVDDDRWTFTVAELQKDAAIASWNEWCAEYEAAHAEAAE